MTNKDMPFVCKIKKPEVFSGELLIKFLNLALKTVSDKTLEVDFPFEMLITEDEYGKEFWNKELAVNVLEIRLKDDYDIKFFVDERHGVSSLYIVIDDIETYRLGFTRLLQDLVDLDKKYLMYRGFIKSFRNMTFQERLNYHKEEMYKQIASKHSKDN